MVARSPAPPKGAAFTVAFGETDLRKLFSPSAFSQGDSYEREGHVYTSTVQPDRLSGDVAGTWTRVDQVAVFAAGGRLDPRCTCGAGPFCPHTAALLLHWLRAPSSFLAIDSETALDRREPPSEQRSDNPFVAEYAGLLDHQLMPELREMARRRNLRITARNKSEMVEKLAAELADPENVDAALRELGPTDRMALDAFDLICAADPVTAERFWNAFHGFAGENAAPLPRGETGWSAGLAQLDALSSLGLVLSAGNPNYGPTTYRLPWAVAVRLPRRTDLVRPATAGAHARGTPSRLTLLELILVIARQLSLGEIGGSVRTLAHAQTAGVPPRWYIHADQREEEAGKRKQGQRDVRLLPYPTALVQRDCTRLAQLTGESPHMISFAFDLMSVLHLVEIVRQGGHPRMLLNQPALNSFVSRSPSSRHHALVNAWLDMEDFTDFQPVLSERGGIELYYRMQYHTTGATPVGRSVRGLVARIIGRLSPDGGRYDFDSFLDLLWRVGPSLLQRGVYAQNSVWWFVAPDLSRKPLDLTRFEHWKRVWGPLVGAILAGPMTWLGLVDTAEHNGKVPNFAVRPASSLLAGYPIEHLSTGKAPWLRIRADSYGTEGTAFVTVLVPAGSPDDGTHALLAAIADVVDASREGIQYKLNVERLRVCFEEGLTGPLLIEMLSARAGGAIPREVRAIIEHWWNSYGTIRLYDNLVLLELGDDVLLHELLATSSLPAALIHQFGPRVVAVDPSRVDDLIAELIRLGYTPRLVDDTDQPAAPRR